MANPRVFISSTCYDLASERDSLIDFCNNFGFDVALSERGDVFFHPDLHTHESCTNEIGNCHLLVLIIGGRFGGRYVVDPEKSITNAEYSAARDAGIPIFTFIKNEVLQDHNVWQSNKGNEFVERIRYPSIDKPEHAIDIFRFIDEVRLAKRNNSYFAFALPREIHGHLRKQWAAMFLEGLTNRNIAKQMLATNEALSRLTSVSQKIEELTKSIYKNVDSVNAESSIESIDRVTQAKEMFHLVGSKVEDNLFLSGVHMNDVLENLPETWWEFLEASGYFDIETRLSEDGTARKVLVYLEGISDSLEIEPPKSKREIADVRTIASGYEAFKSLSRPMRAKIYEEFSVLYSSDDDTEPG
jgi:hypothetical protein